MKELLLLSIAICLPALSAVFCYNTKNDKIRNFFIVASSLIMFCVAGSFIYLLGQADGKIIINFEDYNIPINFELFVKLADLALMVYIIYIGIKLKRPLIITLSALQLVPLLIFDFFSNTHTEPVVFVIDYLSLIMILLITIIGPIISIYAMGYMKDHEHHLHLNKSRQPRFFFIIFIFLGAMNGLVLTDNLTWLYFFWEVTTLCSFLLISHDEDEVSIKNATRALWINMLGGVFFVAAIIIIHKAFGSLSISGILSLNSSGKFVGLIPIALGMLCLAGFTKSAQFPFQSWLLGAMVAPTPVSALLHSSTMVKAGVYLIVRLAPAFAGTLLGKSVAVVGGFTFLAGSAIAISQRNAKKVLAYSTIANLGLIICCAGIGTNIAIGSAILLIIFHALSKGLLFLCVGTIEQGIGSRDIEDMQGLMKKMPFTTVITSIGMISMLLPPFGVLITKWLSLESAVNLPLVLIFIVFGSAFTVVFWSKWIGIILTMSYKTKYNIEKLSFWVKSSLIVLVLGVFVASIGISPMYKHFVEPFLQSQNISDGEFLTTNKDELSLQRDNQNIMSVLNNTTNLPEDIGGFSSIYLFMILFFMALLVPYFLSKVKIESIKLPYLCGENTDDIRGIEFIGPSDIKSDVIVHNYYLTGIFGEENLTPWTNIAAGAIILIMFGVVI